MARRHGKNGDVMMDPTGSTTYVSIANLNNWTWDGSADPVDVTCFNNTNRVSVMGLPSYTGDLAGVWSADSVAIFDAAFAGTAVGLKLIPSTLDATAFFSGLAFLSVGVECPADGAVTISGTWTAADNWTMAP